MNHPLACAACLCAAVAALLSTLVLAQDAPSKEPPAPQPAGYDLLAKRVATAPELKAEVTEAWKQAPAHTVKAVKGKGADVEVEFRAMHDGEKIYLLARWADADQSTGKKGWTFTREGWQQSKDDEDRIALAFDINAEGFAREGCAVLCHYSAMHTPAEGQKADLWHWKAARGGLFGYCDDQHFSGDVKKGRADDDGSSAYKDNQEKDAKQPSRRWKDDADKTGQFTEESSVALDDKFKPAEGTTVPAILLRQPKGSRADVSGIGRHADGFWVVMFSRKLDTGNADDVKFQTGKNLPFTAAVFNNTGAKTGGEHSKSGVVMLRLEE